MPLRKPGILSDLLCRGLMPPRTNLTDLLPQAIGQQLNKQVGEFHATV
jgi:hypothetical protein